MMSKYGNLGLARQECSLPLMKVQRDCSLTGQGLLGRRGTTQQQQQRLPQAWGAPWKSDGETGREPKWSSGAAPGDLLALLPPPSAGSSPEGRQLHCGQLGCSASSPLLLFLAAQQRGKVIYAIVMHHQI